MPDPGAGAAVEGVETRQLVARLLRRRTDDVVRPWLVSWRRRRDPQRREEGRRAVQALLEIVLDSLDGTVSSVPLRDRVAGYAIIRRSEGLDLGAVFADVRHLREAAWAALLPELSGGTLDFVPIAAALGDAFDQLLLGLVRSLHEQELFSLREAATSDSLTGLSNHRYFYQRLEEELKRASRIGYPVSILLLDVDYFKRFNDEHGHPAGDRVLRQLAEVLMTQRRSTDTCARYGGEEFAMVFPATAGKDVCAIAHNLAQRFQLGSGLTFSAGVASFPTDGQSAGELVKAADRALYTAKEEGRDRIRSA